MEPREEFLLLSFEVALQGVESGDGGPFGAVIVRGDDVLAERPQPGRRHQRPDRARRDRRHPRRLRAPGLLPARRLRPVLELRAVPDVPGRDLLGAAARGVLLRHARGRRRGRLRRRLRLRGARAAAGRAHAAHAPRGAPRGRARRSSPGRRSPTASSTSDSRRRAAGVAPSGVCASRRTCQTLRCTAPASPLRRSSLDGAPAPGLATAAWDHRGAMSLTWSLAIPTSRERSSMIWQPSRRCLGLLARALVDEAHAGEVDPSGPLGDEEPRDRLLVVADDRRAPDLVGVALAPVGGEAQEDPDEQERRRRQIDEAPRDAAHGGGQQRGDQDETSADHRCRRRGGAGPGWSTRRARARRSRTSRTSQSASRGRRAAPPPHR